MSALLFLQWMGALTGVTGSYFVGSQIRSQRLFGFALFLCSNFFWIAVAVELNTWGLLAMNIAFMFTSFRGCVANHPRYV